jgi:hypothetical protein
LERFEERACFLLRLIHLPISGDYWTAQGILLTVRVSARMMMRFMAGG